MKHGYSVQYLSSHCATVIPRNQQWVIINTIRPSPPKWYHVLILLTIFIKFILRFRIIRALRPDRKWNRSRTVVPYLTYTSIYTVQQRRAVPPLFNEFILCRNTRVKYSVLYDSLNLEHKHCYHTSPIYTTYIGERSQRYSMPILLGVRRRTRYN